MPVIRVRTILRTIATGRQGFAWGLTWGFVAFALMTSAARLQAQDKPAQKKPTEAERFRQLKPKIQELIEQLGDEDFAVREAAQQRLTRIGVVAFDDLRKAQLHDDVEIARRARYLVRSIQVHWNRPDDPNVIVNSLKEYGDLPQSARSRLLDRLAALNDGMGIPALCRIARFETSDALARRAALLVAGREPGESEDRKQLAKTIVTELGVSRRIATNWLRAYVKSLDDPGESIDDWTEIVASAFDRRDRLPSESNDGQVEYLLKIYIDLLLRTDHNKEASKNAVKLLAFVGGRRDTILDAIDWLLERELYAVIEDLILRYPKQAERFLTIRYRLAESQRKQGKTKEAELSAEAALKSRPEAFDAHVRAAIELQERSLLDWCVRELENVIAKAEGTNLHHIHARLLLSELHHDFERELEAAEAIAPIARLIEKDDKETRDRVQQPPINRNADGVVARMHLFYALHYRTTGELSKQYDHLLKGAAAEEEDADILIAMFQAKGADEKFQKKTAELIEDFLEKSMQQLRDLSDYEGRAPNESTRSDIRNAMAIVNNQYAWLACNTERDLKKAVRCSQRSLELRPNTAAYFDTLAHCYAALDDYQNAVKYQREAVRLEPYTFQITKKLKVFSERLAQSEKP